MHRGYRFKLYPTAEQAETLRQWVGVTRLVYNLALEQRRDFWRQYRDAVGRPIGWVFQSREVTDLRAEFDFIRAVPRTCLEQAIRDLDKAYHAFFAGRAGYPTPRRRFCNDSMRFQAKECGTATLNRKWAALKVPNIGAIKFRVSRQMSGELKNITVVRQAGAWFAVFSCETGEAPAPNCLPVVGIDRGVANTISTSTGEHIRLPDRSDIERKRRRAQRILARRKRGSRRHAKQRRAAAYFAGKLARVRAHHLHVASTDIARRFGVVALERLRVKSMTASAAGTIAEPGRCVAQKRGLNRSILAQGWSIFAAQLDYKLEAAGGRLVYVPAPYTSQTCAECGVVDARSRKSQAVFKCVACGHSDHADTNAAKNIMRGSTAFVEEHQLRSVEARTLAA